MIDRYSRPEMKRVWSDENKYAKWLEVELAACQAWTDEGVIPAEDMQNLRRARFDPQIMDEVFQRTRHDVTAFIASVTTDLGDEGRWIHQGLTSSDVMDTALALQLHRGLPDTHAGHGRLVRGAAPASDGAQETHP